VRHDTEPCPAEVRGKLFKAGEHGHLFQGRGLVEERAAAYVCRGFACQAPVTEPEGLRAKLEMFASLGFACGHRERSHPQDSQAWAKESRVIKGICSPFLASLCR
jgi:hypothetical protein